jgi:hypothetical protein
VVGLCIILAPICSCGGFRVKHAHRGELLSSPYIHLGIQRGLQLKRGKKKTK